jgi:hypothetical protein
MGRTEYRVMMAGWSTWLLPASRGCPFDILKTFTVRVTAGGLNMISRITSNMTSCTTLCETSHAENLDNAPCLSFPAHDSPLLQPPPDFSLAHMLL